MSDIDEKNKSINVAIETIEKQFGKGSIMRLGEDASLADIPVITSGSLGLDIALGVGGFPRGRIVEVFGPEASGKTTIALHAHRGSPEGRRNNRLCRRRTRSLNKLRGGAWHQG